MLSKEIVRDKCPIIISIISLTSFLGLAVAFLVIVLVNNKILDDGVFMTFHMETFKSETFKIGVESPAVVCLIAAIIYAGFSAVSFNPKCDNAIKIGTNMVDSIFIPLLLCALVMLNDLLHIVFMIALYTIYKMLVHEMTATATEYISVRISISSTVAVGSVWSAYFIGWIFNHRHVKRGGGLAQLCVLGLFVYDVYKVIKKGDAIKHEFGLQMANRFILLLCVFIEEF